MNYLNNDELERYWFQYKAEYEPHGLSLEQFCNTQRISYRAMDNWSRQIRSKVVPVEVEGIPEQSNADKSDKDESQKRTSNTRFVSCKHRQQPKASSIPTLSTDNRTSENIRIMVTIKATNGLSIFQKNLSYEGLRLLVERLEGIC